MEKIENPPTEESLVHIANSLFKVGERLGELQGTLTATLWNLSSIRQALIWLNIFVSAALIKLIFF